jgi:hypothetical protein
MSSFPKKCVHNKVKYTCVECGGKGICLHKKNRAYCKECKGSSICEHGHSKYACRVEPCNYIKKKKKQPSAAEMELLVAETKRKCFITKI